MNILLDGWSVLLVNGKGIFILLITIWGLGSWGTYIFFRDQELSFLQRLLISINLGALILTWLCILVVLLGQISYQVLVFGCIMIPTMGIFFLLQSVLKKPHDNGLSSDLFFLLIIGVCLFLFLLSRLAFVRHIILPPYDDSPEHYSIIMGLLDIQKARPAPFYSLLNITQHYYHFGFHSIAAWITVVSKSDVAQVMIWLGQIFIVYSSLSVFLLALVLTESIPGAFVAALFAGIAWRMPAFAANWGKYPAITGLAFLPGWVGLYILYQKYPRSKMVNRLFFLMLVAGLGLIHTRLLICAILIGMGYFIAERVIRARDKSYIQACVLFCIALLSILAFLKPITVYYSTGAFLPVGFVILLLPFAVQAYPRTVFSLSLAILGVWLASKVPVFFEGYGANWLDGPFVELLLFIPLSLFAGLGFAAILKTFPRWIPFPQKFAILLPVLIALIGFGSSHSFVPDKCCNYVTEADLSAIEWIDQHTGANAVIWIAGFKPKNYMLGTDAGIWVSALTGRNVNKLRYNFNWAEANPRKLCQEGYTDVFVYQGSMPYSFEDFGLRSATWLMPVYRANSTNIYRFSC